MDVVAALHISLEAMTCSLTSMVQVQSFSKKL